MTQCPRNIRNTFIRVRRCQRNHHSGLFSFSRLLEDGVDQGGIHRFPRSIRCQRSYLFLRFGSRSPHDACVSFRNFSNTAIIFFISAGVAGGRAIDSARSDFDRRSRTLPLPCNENGTVASRGYRDNLSNSRGVAIVARPISAKKTMKLARNIAVKLPRSRSRTGFGRKGVIENVGACATATLSNLFASIASAICASSRFCV